MILSEPPFTERDAQGIAMSDEQDIEIAILKIRLEQMQKDVSEIKSSVSDLVDAWKSAGLMVSLVKTAAAIVLSVGVLIGAFKFGILPSEAGK